MVPAPESSRSRGLILAFAVGFAVAAGVALVLARHTGLTAFIALAALNAWALLVAGANLLPRFSYRLREVFIGLAVITVVAIPVWFHHLKASAFTGASDSILQLGAVVLAVLAFAAYFLSTYATHVARETPAAVINALIPLVRLLASAHALVVIALLARLYVEKNLLQSVSVLLYLATAALVVEFLLHSIARLYQPPRLRGREIVFGQS